MGIEFYPSLADRLRTGKPLLLNSDVGASLRQQLVLKSGPGHLGKAVREHPSALKKLYELESDAGADILISLAFDTTPRSLTEVGMGHRAAWLTGVATDRVSDAVENCGRPMLIASKLSGYPISPHKLSHLLEELDIHAQRLATAGTDLVLTYGTASQDELLAAIQASLNAAMPAWAVLHIDALGALSLHNTSVPAIIQKLEDAGTSAILFEISSPEHAAPLVEAFHHSGSKLPLGLLLAANLHCLEGYPEGALSPEIWAERAAQLQDAHPNLRVLGGGRGCTHLHLAALHHRLQEHSPPPSLSLSVY
jgi:S-methylmethionine-dependent homocysteine/selenocysteine methylase